MDAGPPAETSASENRPSVNPLRKTRRYVTRPRDEEGYTPGARKKCLYKALIGHTGSHTQESIKLILQLTSDPLPYPATQQPAQPPGTPIPLTRRSRVKQFSKQPRREHFFEIPLPPEARRGPVSELPLQPEACRGPISELLLQPRARRDSISEPLRQSGPQGGAISLPQNNCHSVSHHQQSLPRSARPDLILEVGLEPPTATPASCTPCEDQQVTVEPVPRVPREDLPPVVLEIPSGSPEFKEEPPRTPESPQCPDTPGKWFRPHTHSRSSPRSRSFSPPSPRRSRKCLPSSGGGLSIASASSEGGSIGYRDRCLPVPQIKQNFSAPLPVEIHKVNILILSLVVL